MIKVEGNVFYRGGAKIGWMESKYIVNHTGEKVGFTSGDHVFDKGGSKIAYIEGDYIHFIHSGKKIRIEDNNRDVMGGSLSNIEKAAVRALLGE